MANITLNELAYRIMGLYRASHKDTDNLSIRLVKDWIHSTRAMLLKQRLDKPFAYIDDNLIQTITPVSLEDIDSSTFSEESSERKMLRTTIDIPPTINRRGQIECFTRIGPIDRLERKYKVVSHEHALVAGSGKFNRKEIYAFRIGERIYLISKDLNPEEKLDIRGVFQNPTQIPGFSDDGPYPINRELIDTMEEMIVKTKFPTTLVGYADTKADEADNIVQTTEKRSK
jgi:hypothetical protein